MHLNFAFFSMIFIKLIVTISVHIVIITIVHLPQCKAQPTQTDLSHVSDRPPPGPKTTSL